MKKKIYFILSSLTAGGAERVYWLLSQYFNKAKEAAERAAILRLAVFGNEELSEPKFREQTKAKKSTTIRKHFLILH